MALNLDAVGAKNLYEAPVDEPTDGLQHAAILCFKVAAQGSGKDDQRVAVGAKGEHLDVMADYVRGSITK